MMSFDEYRKRVLALGSALSSEAVPLHAAQGMVTAEPVFARFAVPPFDNSAMDGFAVRSEDVASAPVTLRVTADIPAGRTDVPELEPGAAMRIMTGAPMPKGADAIVQVEKTENPERNMRAEAPDEVTILEAVPSGRNLRFAGEDIDAGELAIEAGVRLGPTQLSALASIGHGFVRVHRRPVVGVLSTGSELRKPGEDLQPGQIPDSNSTLVRLMVREAGGQDILLSSSSDDTKQFEAIIKEHDYLDALVTTGGVSAGAFDVVKEYLSEHGVDFVSVAQQPGKPQGSGMLRIGDREIPVLCLPGNPVSVFVSMKVYGDSLIAKLSGLTDTDIPWQVWKAGASWTTSAGRAQFMPVVADGDRVVPAGRGGSKSHLVYSLMKTRGLAYIPADVDSVDHGDDVRVWWL
ncbi:gephyrin-like molybdotransferase Glp [Flaviflexus huanghaiensis]|uniref:molybdopterin molybdotransferase MoeA n=1 Tax=Flaviflexus huanghaiensis TaxID=1111473 RepID=UPI0015FBC343|nr:gephyrin-like molybdotransferase Glp [Flaviflexus huanghaiensis]